MHYWDKFEDFLFSCYFFSTISPVSVVVKTMGADSIDYANLIFGSYCDLLDKYIFNNIMELAASGLIGGTLTAPYCSKYSMAHWGQMSLNQSAFQQQWTTFQRIQLFRIFRSRSPQLSIIVRDVSWAWGFVRLVFFSLRIPFVAWYFWTQRW